MCLTVTLQPEYMCVNGREHNRHQQKKKGAAEEEEVEDGDRLALVSHLKLPVWEI